MKIFFCSLMAACLPVIVSAQITDKTNTHQPEPITLYTTVMAGGCVDNPFSFIVGVQKPFQPHLSLAGDIHLWSTGYECFCDDIHTIGHFSDITPSVKLIYNTGKQTGRGLIAGLGLGYMFARDRGTEQHYTKDPVTLVKTFEDKVSPGNWDFSSIAPSFSIGIGFRLWHFPVSFSSQYYFAHTAADGWQPTAGGAGFSFGFRKL